MEKILLHALAVFMGFSAIMNPIANIPIFLSLTRGEDKQTKSAIASSSLILAFIIVVVFNLSNNLPK